MTIWITQNGNRFRYTPPNARASTSTVPASTLNEQQPASDRIKNISADNRVIPLVYGHAQVGGKIFAIDFSDGVTTIGYVVALGEINGYVRLLADGEPIPAGVTVNQYTGTATQGVDPLLAGAIDNYEDTLPNVAYVVLQYAPDVFETWPRLVAEIEGKLIDGAYTENPSRHLADLLSSTEYGPGYTVDATSLTTAAAANDDDSIGEVRRKSFIVMDRPRETEQWIETLRVYAGVFLVYRGSTVYLIPDRPASSSRTFTASDIVSDSMRIRKQDTTDLPTVMQVMYTDTSQNEWRDRQADEVAISGAPRRVSRVRLNGITRHSQALREATERLNKLTLSDLRVDFVAFDEALDTEVGDVITVSHPYGLTSKLLRVVDIPEQVEPGRWQIRAEEYDAAAYSDSVIEQASTPDTRLPVNAPPDAVTGLSLSETTYQLQNGKYASRIDIAFVVSTSAFVTCYAVRVLSGAEVVWGPNVNSTTISTSPLEELIPYTVEVRALTTLFTGDAATATYTIIGKTAIPDAPATLNGFEAGGEVRLNWPASTDIDAERYEVRYGPTGGVWADATQLDIVDGLRLVTKDVPEGTWQFYVRTIDSIAQLSNDQATLTLTVTLDNDAFTAAQRDPLEGAFADMTNMHESKQSRLSPYKHYYADSGESWSTLFGSAAMNTFTAPLASYQTLPANAVYLSPETDLIEDKSGNFRATVDIDDYGTAAQAVGIKPDGGTYDYVNQLSRQGTGRFTRARVTGSDPFVVRGSGGSLRVDIVAVEETGDDTSLTSGGKKITLSKQYAAARSIIITPQGSTARSASYDNIVLDDGGVTTFDVYVFDSSGAQIAADFLWLWKGV
mgnify:CR=1 FL=1